MSRQRGCTTAATSAQVRESFPLLDPNSRPMMRWWWFGPDVEDVELERELQAMHDAGIGGVEVAFVYPLRAGSAEFGSETMLARLAHAARYARELGQRFDVTLGSGWSYGGAHINPEHASKRLRWERRDISAPAMEVPLAPGWPGDELIAVYLGDGFPPTNWQMLPVDGGMVRIPPGRGPRTVLLAWSQVTGQQVKRASAGAEGPVLDHLSAEATSHHLDVVGRSLLEAVPAELIGSVFSDSLEVYEANWTPNLPEEFRRRRGYELLPLLYRLQVDEPGSAQLRIDVGRTLTELVEENFIATCRDWAREHGVRFRLQGYGEPPVTVSSNRYADLIEGEGCGWAELTQLRWAASAGHLYGREVISSEIWTWVHSPSFRATPLDLKGEAHEHFLLGSNQFVGHGWPYSPPDAPGVGWYFYAAGALDDRNPWWPAAPLLMEYLTRISWALRQGEPVADIALYLPADDIYATQGAGFDLWKACRDHIGSQIPAAIRRGGYDVDVIDDHALAGLDPTAFPVVVLPEVTRLPQPVRRWLDAAREAGGTVIAVGGTAYPSAVLTDHTSFAEVLGQVLAPDLAVERGEGEIGIVHRRLADGDLYFLANTGPQVRTVELAPRTPRRRFEWWDPRTGSTRPAAPGPLTLTLHPYEARLLLGTDEPAPSDADPACPGRDNSAGTVATEPGADARAAVGAAHDHDYPLTGPWTFLATSDPLGATTQSGPVGQSEPTERTGPAQAPTEISLPHSWEETGHGAHTSGVYEAAVTLDDTWMEDGAQVTLDLGPCRPVPAPAAANGYRVEVAPPVREIAVVSVDGLEIGVLWDAPFRIDLTSALRPGTVTIRLEVRTTAAAAVAADEHAAQIVAASHDAYGMRFQQQDLDRVLDDVSYGLHTVPVLRMRRAVQR